MARQGGQVQLEQSNMHLALNMAKMAKERFSHTTVEETRYLIKKLRTEVRAENKWSVGFPGHTIVRAVIDTHPAILHQNYTAGCLPCQNGTRKNPLTCWRCPGTGAPSPDLPRELSAEPTPPLPGTPAAPTGNDSGGECSQIVNLLHRYAYSHSSCPCSEFFTLDASAQNCPQDTDFDPVVLTDDGTSTG